MSRRDRNLQEQEFSKNEKKVFGIIGIVCLALMALVIVVTIITTSDSHTIAKNYDLDTNNVFEYITLDKIEEKQINEESFHIVIVRSATSKTKTFMQIADQHAKDFKIRKIYLLEVGTMTKTEATKLCSIIEERYSDVFGNNAVMSLPALVYFEKGSPMENSGLKKLDNQTSQIKEYFSNCGYTYEEKNED